MVMQIKSKHVSASFAVAGLLFNKIQIELTGNPYGRAHLKSVNNIIFPSQKDTDDEVKEHLRQNLHLQDKVSQYFLIKWISAKYYFGKNTSQWCCSQMTQRFSGS